MSNIAKHEIRIAFDNAGGAVLASKTYAHVYSDGKQLATDVRALLDSGDTDDWDGNDEEVCAAFPSEADRYDRVYRMKEIAELAQAADGENANLGVEVDDDTHSVQIHWGQGSRPQSGTGYMEYEFWSALLA
jgi:hypothetical protein